MTSQHIWKICFSMILVFSLLDSINGNALQLDSSSIDNIIGETELVFINFYADWCRFSNMLAPIWDEAALKVKQDHPDDKKVVIAKVDCDKETSIATRFQISKYPTLKLLRNGQPAKKEYRGKRSAEAIAAFINEQLTDTLVKFNSLTEISDIDKDKKRVVIGYFEKEGAPEYEIFRRISKQLKDDCHFYAGFGDVVKSMHPPGQSIIAFKSSVSQEDVAYLGRIDSYDELSAWVTSRCIPLVREITFENAEELTEEGIPFLILFHTAEDTESVQKFMTIIETELLDQKQSINFLTADSVQFAHPLHHLGKSKKDLPLIAIDSFRHMYPFPDFKRAEVKGTLREFVLDLHNGKLHREFHQGPDPVNTVGQDYRTKVDPRSPTTPPESAFKNLGPSKHRYTLLKDEL